MHYNLGKNKNNEKYNAILFGVITHSDVNLFLGRNIFIQRNNGIMMRYISIKIWIFYFVLWL